MNYISGSALSHIDFNCHFGILTDIRAMDVIKILAAHLFYNHVIFVLHGQLCKHKMTDL